MQECDKQITFPALDQNPCCLNSNKCIAFAFLNPVCGKVVSHKQMRFNLLESRFCIADLAWKENISPNKHQSIQNKPAGNESTLIWIGAEGENHMCSLSSHIWSLWCCVSNSSRTLSRVISALKWKTWKTLSKTSLCVAGCTETTFQKAPKQVAIKKSQH